MPDRWRRASRHGLPARRRARGAPARGDAPGSRARHRCSAFRRGSVRADPARSELVARPTSRPPDPLSPTNCVAPWPLPTTRSQRLDHVPSKRSGGQSLDPGIRRPQATQVFRAEAIVIRPVSEPRRPRRSDRRRARRGTRRSWERRRRESVRRGRGRRATRCSGPGRSPRDRVRRGRRRWSG